MKHIGPKARTCRKYGSNIYGSDKYDKVLQKKPQGPGKGPRSRQGRKSEYAQQLLEKQKVRDMYCMSESQFRSIYKAASGAKGKTTGDVIKELLERRLDNVVYRAGFALTRPQARQFVTHGLFKVNGRRVTVPSYRVREGDTIEIREQSKSSPIFSSVLAAHEKYMPPGWLKANAGAISAEVVNLPTADDAEQAIDIRQVIEFYSRN